MAKKNNNQVSAVRQAKHGWIWTLAFTVISIRLHLEKSRFPLAGINLSMVLNVHSVAG